MWVGLILIVRKMGKHVLFCGGILTVIRGLDMIDQKVKIFKKRAHATTFTFLLRFRGGAEEGVWCDWRGKN